MLSELEVGEGGVYVCETAPLKCELNIFLTPPGFYTNQLLPVLQNRISHELLEEVKNNNL